MSLLDTTLMPRADRQLPVESARILREMTPLLVVPCPMRRVGIQKLMAIAHMHRVEALRQMVNSHMQKDIVLMRMLTALMPKE